MKRFFCPKCGKFKSRLQVRFEEYWLPHYCCKYCGEETIETKAVVEFLVLNEIKNRMVKGEK